MKYVMVEWRAERSARLVDVITLRRLAEYSELELAQL
jgi:hypothetical protein